MFAGEDKYPDLEECNFNLKNNDMEISGEFNIQNHLEGQTKTYGRIIFSPTKATNLENTCESHILQFSIAETPTRIGVHDCKCSLDFPSAIRTDDKRQGIENSTNDENIIQEFRTFNPKPKTLYMDTLSNNPQTFNMLKFSDQSLGEIGFSPNKGKNPTHLVTSHTYQSEWPFQSPLPSNNFDICFGNVGSIHRMGGIQILGERNLHMLDPGMNSLASEWHRENEHGILNELNSKNDASWDFKGAYQSGDSEDFAERQTFMGAEGQHICMINSKSSVDKSQNIVSKSGDQDSVTRKRKLNRYKHRDVKEKIYKSTTLADTHQPKDRIDQCGFKLITFLQYQGMLEMGVHFGISSSFSRILKDIYNTLLGKILEKKNIEPDYIKTLERSFCRAETSIVKGFFGALSVL